MNSNLLDRMGDIGLLVVATCMLIIYLYLVEAWIGARLEERFCQRYADVCRLTRENRKEETKSRLFPSAA